jgi:hypothetical protein
MGLPAADTVTTADAVAVALALPSVGLSDAGLHAATMESRSTRPFMAHGTPQEIATHPFAAGPTRAILGFVTQESDPPADDDGTYKMVMGRDAGRFDFEGEDAAADKTVEETPDEAADEPSDGAFELASDGASEEATDAAFEEAPNEAAEQAADDAPSEAAAPDKQPQHTDIDPLLAQGSYAEIHKLLGPVEKARELPASLALIFSMSHKEVGAKDPGNEVNQLAITSVATLLGESASDHTALMLAKRILRKHTPFTRRKAPNAPVRIAVVLLGIALGVVGGWFAGPGSVRFVEVLETALP